MTSSGPSSRRSATRARGQITEGSPVEVAEAIPQQEQLSADEVWPARPNLPLVVRCRQGLLACMTAQSWASACRAKEPKH
jgi:hypothetical protein